MFSKDWLRFDGFISEWAIARRVLKDKLFYKTDCRLDFLPTDFSVDRIENAVIDYEASSFFRKNFDLFLPLKIIFLLLIQQNFTWLNSTKLEFRKVPENSWKRFLRQTDACNQDSSSVSLITLQFHFLRRNTKGFSLNNRYPLAHVVLRTRIMINKWLKYWKLRYNLLNVYFWTIISK